MGVDLVLDISFLLIYMYLDHLVHAMIMQQGFAICVGYTLLQKVQGSYAACFGLLQLHE